MRVTVFTNGTLLQGRAYVGKVGAVVVVRGSRVEALLPREPRKWFRLAALRSGASVGTSSDEDERSPE